MGKRLSGTAYFKAGDMNLKLSAEIEVMLSTSKKEGLVGPSGVAGYDEQPLVPYIEGEFFHEADVKLDALDKLDNITATVELANGQVGVLSEAWCCGELKPSGGKFTARFEGMDGEWI